MNRRDFLTLTASSALLLPKFIQSAYAETGAPPLKEQKDYLSVTHTVTFNGRRSDVRRALFTPEGGVLNFVEPTPSIPGIHGFQPILGAFPEQGAVRKVILTDGNAVTERVVRNNQDVFEYQIWDLTAKNGWAVDHIRGRFDYKAVSNEKTVVTWEYAIAPSSFVAKPFIKRFLKRDFQPFLTSGLEGAARNFNTK